MSFLDKLERRFGFLAFNNLTLYLIIGQVAMFGLITFSSDPMEVMRTLVFSWERFLSGEVWRIVTFMLMPPQTHWIWLVFAWMVFYLMGTTLEAYWGAFRYNLYIITGMFGALLAGLLAPRLGVVNYYLLYSVTFGFAYLNPNFELRIYFILPVKMKWIAAFIGVMLLIGFIQAGIYEKLLLLGSLINFPLFFGVDFVRRLRSRNRVREMKAAKKKLESEPFHVCSECGATDLSHPDRDFRYREEGAVCSECVEAKVED